MFKQAVIVFLALSLVVSADISPTPRDVCDEQYDYCITSCCDACGSTISTNAAGDKVCYLGSSDNPNQACVNACLPCSTEYQTCLTEDIPSPIPRPAPSGCCLGAVLLVLAGFMFVLKARE